MYKRVQYSSKWGGCIMHETLMKINTFQKSKMFLRNGLVASSLVANRLQWLRLLRLATITAIANDYANDTFSTDFFFFGLV